MTEAPEVELREDLRRNCCDFLRLSSSPLLSLRYCEDAFLGDLEPLPCFFFVTAPRAAPAKPALIAAPINPDFLLSLELERDRE